MYKQISDSGLIGAAASLIGKCSNDHNLQL